MNPAIVSLVTISCGLAGSQGRHIQGGAGPRWQAMVLYAICLLPINFVYGHDWWQGSAIAITLTAIFYANMTVGQAFGNLWLGAFRYCGIFMALAGITGCWWVLGFMVPVFLVLKWAKSATNPADPHVLFEEVLGFCTGAAWGLAPLIRGW